MKVFSRPKRNRIHRIVGMIRDGGRLGRLPNAGDIARELGVSSRTILRDLDILRDDDNALIAYDPVRHGYYLTDPTWELPDIQISRGELFAFSVAHKVIQAYRGTPLEVDMRSVMAKIEHSLEGKVTISPSALLDRFTVMGEDYVRQDPDIWATVIQAADRRNQIEIRYEKFNGKLGAYLLDPYHLNAYHGNWYVLAYHHGRRHVATFALSRIREVRLTGVSFPEPDEAEIRDMLNGSFGITGGEKPFRVHLRFSPNVAGYIRERIWHPTQDVRSRRDGGVDLRLETSGWKELVRFVLSWQPDVQVVSPQRLRRRVVEIMQNGIDLNSEG